MTGSYTTHTCQQCLCAGLRSPAHDCDLVRGFLDSLRVEQLRSRTHRGIRPTMGDGISPKELRVVIDGNIRGQVRRGHPGLLTPIKDRSDTLRQAMVNKRCKVVPSDDVINLELGRRRRTWCD